MKGFIFDLKSSENKVKILFKNKEEKIIKEEFQPYFYLKKYDKEIKSMPEIIKVEKVKKKDNGKEITVYKITVDSPGSVIKLRKDLREFEPMEAKIPYTFRYLIDNNLYATRTYEFDKKFKKTEPEPSKLKIAAFDIETYNKNGISDPKKDPILMISYCDEDEQTVFHWTKGKSTEKEVILDFLNKIKKKNIDVLTGYNSSGFDLPYLKKRCSVLDIGLDLSKDGSPVNIKKGAFSTKADIFGLLHLDSYDGVMFLNKIGAMNIPKKDLESVYKEMFGKEKVDIEIWDLWKMWEKGGKELEKVIQYNKEDAIAAFEIAKEILPLYVEISKIVGMPIYEVSRMSTSQMVEWLLIREAFKQNLIVPRSVREEEIKARTMNPIKGAFVKLPKKGLHENIAVCDFRSLYPTLIIAYNIDATTLAKKGNKSPMGHYFAKKPQGLIPKMLQELLETRMKVKKEMKKYKRETIEYKSLYYRQWALKIIANSAYGYMAYPRALWYSREAGESVTAWARQYIHKTIEKAEKEGFEVIYADTDSVFLKLENEKQENKVTDFVKKINKDLPEGMELEFEGFYPRGIFVSKKEGEAAKKKYALMRKDGTLEIKGFELVRRDWSNIAKETQKKVITAILEQGKPEKAIEIAKKTIQDIKDRKIDNKEFIIYTQIKRKVENYEQQAPHVKAAKRLIKAGYKIKVGTMLEYIVTQGSGNISDRSVPIQLIENKKYDADYYIENQVLPAVMKIMRELGVTEDELKYKGKQSGLGDWN